VPDRDPLRLQAVAAYHSGEVVLHGLVEADLALVHQLQHHRGDEHLGLAAHPEPGIGAQLGGRRELGAAAAVPGDGIAVAYGRHRPDGS
jgi:hypothetical protein